MDNIKAPERDQEEEIMEYRVHVPQDGLGGEYENPSPKSQHGSLNAAIRAARSYGWRPTTDGAATEPVALIIRSDGAQLHPWATNPDRDWA